MFSPGCHDLEYSNSSQGRPNDNTEGKSSTNSHVKISADLSDVNFRFGCRKNNTARVLYSRVAHRLSDGLLFFRSMRSSSHRVCLEEHDVRHFGSHVSAFLSALDLAVIDIVMRNVNVHIDCHRVS